MGGRGESRRGDAALNADLPDAGPVHAGTAEELLLRLRCDPDRGLDLLEVERRRGAHGVNQLREAGRSSAWPRFLRQFREVVVVLLFAAAAISLALGDWLDAAAILVIVLLNGLLGFLQEERAARALESLRELARPSARVLREGRERVLDARELVPGDVILVEAGDAIPADARLLRTAAFRAQEAALTGESSPVDKDERAGVSPRTPLGERRNSIYFGTLAAAGRATALVVATGMSTELGRIAAMLAATAPRPTPLQERLSALGRVLAAAALAMVLALAAVHLARGDRFGDVLVLSIGLAVAAVPEGLPAVVTLALAVGMHRLVERNALVRRLPGVETLGCVTVICTDKTGTLTRNEMTVRELWTPSGTARFAGSGYSPQGEIAGEGGGDPRQDPGLVRALTIGARCNGARLEAPRQAGGAWTVVGDPTEGALLVAARKAGIPLELGPGERVLFELPFDSERRRMSVALEGPAGTIVHVKGAPEVLLPLCSSLYRAGRAEALDEEWRARIRERCRGLGARALRVLALAFREGPADAGQAEHELCFAGLVGMQDPPRPEAREAVSTCREAGIRPVMITGDQVETALAIAREIGLCGADQAPVSGAELDGWSDQELAASLERSAVFARASAEHKLRIVRAWRGRGAVVAMTGDGVNDAPALQEADIGIAMGRTGTDVTRAAADMVLLDDNFASIVAAVREGRGIFDNIRKAVHFLLSANLAELGLMTAATLFGWPLPLTALQLLWVNLVTDGLPALALALEPTEAGVMRRLPLGRGAPVITRAEAASILGRGLSLSLAAVLAFGLTLRIDPSRAAAVAFATTVFGQLALALAFRSREHTLPELGPLTNARLLAAVLATALLQLGVQSFAGSRALFGIAALAPADWLLVLTASLAPVTAVELAKLLRRAARTRRAGLGRAR